MRIRRDSTQVRHDDASARAAALAPESLELAFWAAVHNGQDVSGFPARWQELRRRLG